MLQWGHKELSDTSEHSLAHAAAQENVANTVKPALTMDAHNTSTPGTALAAPAWPPQQAASLTVVSFSAKEGAGRAGTRAPPGLSHPEAELSGAPNRPRDVSTSHPTAHTLFKNPTTKHTHQLHQGVITGEDTATGGRAG